MFCPCNYGFIPHPLSVDGNLVDVLVLLNYSVIYGGIIKCRPIIGILKYKE